MSHSARWWTLVGKHVWGVLRMRDLPIATTGDPNAADITNFFTQLTADLTVFALAMAGFFFALAALFYIAAGATGNERTRSHAVNSLYAALAGLALALLAGTITLLVKNAATGV